MHILLASAQNHVVKGQSLYNVLHKSEKSTIGEILSNISLILVIIFFLLLVLSSTIFFFFPEIQNRAAKMMHMTFYWGRQVTLLFDFWRTDSWPSYALTLLACFLFSAFYQYLEDRRVRLNRIAVGQKPAIADVETPLLQRKVVGKFSAARIAGTALFGINSGVGYLLMLAIMSFNGGVFLAVVLGLMIGYLVFRSESDDVTLVVDNPCACA